jgi:hypothetical protein
VRVADCASADAGAQRSVPALDVEPRQLLQPLGADVRHNLVLNELPVALCSSRRDGAGRFPLVNARSHEICQSGLSRLDVGALPYRRDEFGELILRRALRALEAHVLNVALAGGRLAAGIKLQFERALAALSDMAPHFELSLPFFASAVCSRFTSSGPSACRSSSVLRADSRALG